MKSPANKKIEWHLKKILLSKLKPFEFNPRKISEKGLKDLKKSIDNFGLAEPIVINTDMIIIGGHDIDVILRRYHNLYPNSKIECINRTDFNFDRLFNA